jgi:hypothetical protein
MELLTSLRQKEGGASEGKLLIVPLALRSVAEQNNQPLQGDICLFGVICVGMTL